MTHGVQRGSLSRPEVCSNKLHGKNAKTTTLHKQEAFEKCWAHSPLRAAARPNFTLPFTRCRYCRTPPLSDAVCCASISTTTTTTTRDRGYRYGPIEWAQRVYLLTLMDRATLPYAKSTNARHNAECNHLWQRAICAR